MEDNEFLKTARGLKTTKDDYRKVFIGSPEGKRVLLDLLQFCGVIRPVYVPGDLEATATNEGVRTVALTILDQLDMRGYKQILEMEKQGINLLEMGEDL